MADEYYGIAAIPFARDVHEFGGSDFPAFFGGARLFFTDPSHAYDPQTQGSAILATRHRGPEDDSPWNRYYNPPAYSLLLGPLTLLDLRSAYAVALLLNVAGLAVLLAVIRRILQGRRMMFLLFAGALVSSQPVNYAFWHAQPTMFLSAALGLLFLDTARGMRSGWIASVLLLKPHWLFVPALTLRSPGKRQLVAFAVGVAALSLPFMALGTHGIIDYLRLILGRGREDLGDESFAEAVLSWSGFFRGFRAEPDVAAALVMSVVTLALYIVVRLGGDRDLLPLAGCAAFLLVVPHSHPQEWVMLAPSAAVLLRSQTSAVSIFVTTCLLLGIYLGMDNWSGIADRRYVIYWPTVGAFALLIWVTVLAEYRRRVAQSAAGPDRVLETQPA